jgi:hypothetical protein
MDVNNKTKVASIKKIAKIEFTFWFQFFRRDLSIESELLKTN